ncbi:hypothetical protein ACQJ1Y_27210, partial [Pseudomonas kitaguniensis]
GTPSLSEVPSGGARAFWLLLRFSKVTRCKSGTDTSHKLNNGYTLKTPATNLNTAARNWLNKNEF